MYISETVYESITKCLQYVNIFFIDSPFPQLVNTVTWHTL